MRLWLRIAIVTVLFVAALPFITLSAMGWMKPAEGFCVEHGGARRGDAPTPEETAQSYFVSPEFSSRAVWVTEHFTWPQCIRSRRGEHRSYAWMAESRLARLREPNFARLHETDPNARVLRVVTVPSFSRVSIAIRVHGAGEAHAAWLVDNEPTPPQGRGPEAYQAWEDGPLPIERSSAPISRAEAEALWTLARRTPERGPCCIMDGTWLVVETIEGGRHDADFVLFDGDASVLFCRLALLAQVPRETLEAGDARCAA